MDEEHQISSRKSRAINIHMAAIIRAYWAAQGYAVDIWVEKTNVKRRFRTDSSGISNITEYTINSDMVNGSPTRKLRPGEKLPPIKERV